MRLRGGGRVVGDGRDFFTGRMRAFRSRGRLGLFYVCGMSLLHVALTKKQIVS